MSARPVSMRRGTFQDVGVGGPPLAGASAQGVGEAHVASRDFCAHVMRTVVNKGVEEPRNREVVSACFVIEQVKPAEDDDEGAEEGAASTSKGGKISGFFRKAAQGALEKAHTAGWTFKTRVVAFTATRMHLIATASNKLEPRKVIAYNEIQSLTLDRTRVCVFRVGLFDGRVFFFNAVRFNVLREFVEVLIAAVSLDRGDLAPLAIKQVANVKAMIDDGVTSSQADTANVQRMELMTPAFNAVHSMGVSDEVIHAGGYDLLALMSFVRLAYPAAMGALPKTFTGIVSIEVDEDRNSLDSAVKRNLQATSRMTAAALLETLQEKMSTQNVELNGVLATEAGLVLDPYVPLGDLGLGSFFERMSLKLVATPEWFDHVHPTVAAGTSGGDGGGGRRPRGDSTVDFGTGRTRGESNADDGRGSPIGHTNPVFASAAENEWKTNGSMSALLAGSANPTLPAVFVLPDDFPQRSLTVQILPELRAKDVLELVLRSVPRETKEPLYHFMLLTPEGFPVEGRTMAAHGLGSLYADRILLHVARRPDEEVADIEAEIERRRRKRKRQEEKRRREELERKMAEEERLRLIREEEARVQAELDRRRREREAHDAAEAARLAALMAANNAAEEARVFALQEKYDQDELEARMRLLTDIKTTKAAVKKELKAEKKAARAKNAEERRVFLEEQASLRATMEAALADDEASARATLAATMESLEAERRAAIEAEMAALAAERRAETEAMLADAQAVEEKRLADFLEDQRLAIGRRLESEEAGARAAVADCVRALEEEMMAALEERYAAETAAKEEAMKAKLETEAEWLRNQLSADITEQKAAMDQQTRDEFERRQRVLEEQIADQTQRLVAEMNARVEREEAAAKEAAAARHGAHLATLAAEAEERVLVYAEAEAERQRVLVELAARIETLDADQAARVTHLETVAAAQGVLTARGDAYATELAGLEAAISKAVEAESSVRDQIAEAEAMLAAVLDDVAAAEDALADVRAEADLAMILGAVNGLVDDAWGQISQAQLEASLDDRRAVVEAELVARTEEVERELDVRRRTLDAQINAVAEAGGGDLAAAAAAAARAVTLEANAPQEPPAPPPMPPPMPSGLLSEMGPGRSVRRATTDGGTGAAAGTSASGATLAVPRVAALAVDAMSAEVLASRKRSLRHVDEEEAERQRSQRQSSGPASLMDFFVESMQKKFSGNVVLDRGGSGGGGFSDDDFSDDDFDWDDGAYV